MTRNGSATGWPDTASVAIALAVALAVAVLLAIVGPAHDGWRAEPQDATLPARPLPLGTGPPAASGRTVTTAPSPAPIPQASQAVRPAAAAPPTDRTRPGPGDLPYRFVGTSTSVAGTSIVLFGRGRVVTLHGPGPIDDEYTVDALLDGYLVLRHVPTGVGRFLALERRRPASGAAADPEETARD
jgi:hypothetical protein